MDSAPGVLEFLNRLARGPTCLDESLQLQRPLAAHCNLILLISRCQRKTVGQSRQRHRVYLGGPGAR